MKALPVVRRDLRIASRRPHTYRLRTLTAGSVVGIGLLVLLLTSKGNSQRELGRYLFAWGAWLAFAWSWVVGVTLTADCFSFEKRNRTLGLLFLTDLRSADIVLGKLSAISLQALYALLAVFPALMITVLMGGVTGMEVARVGLVLVLVMSLALMTGAVASSIFTEVRASLIAGVALALVWVTLGPLVELGHWYWAAGNISKPLSVWFLSPLATMVLAFEEYQRTTEARLWFRTGLSGMILVIGLLLWLSLVMVRRSWLKSEVADGSLRGPSWWQQIRFRGCGGGGSHHRLLESNPIEWLVERDRLGPMLAWALILGFGLVGGLVMFHAHREAYSRFYREMWLQLGVLALFIIHWLYKLLVATETPRRLADDKRSGALEMLLVTPVIVPQLLHGQVTGWIRSYGWQALCLVIMNAIMLWLSVIPDGGIRLGFERSFFVVLTVGGIFMLVVDLFALFWVGMDEGIRAQRQHHAILKTVFKVQIVPWSVVLLLGLVTSAGRGISDEDMEGLASFWVVGSIIYAFIIGSRARQRLERDFRTLAGQATLLPGPSRVSRLRHFIRVLWP